MMVDVLVLVVPVSLTGVAEDDGSTGPFAQRRQLRRNLAADGAACRNDSKLKDQDKTQNDSRRQAGPCTARHPLSLRDEPLHASSPRFSTF